MDNLEILKTKSLDELEAIVYDGLEKFYLVGTALKIIKDKKKYLEKGYNSFEEYCQKKFNISQSMGYHLMSASNVVDSIEGDIIPTKSSHASKLYVIKDENLRNKAWEEVLDTGLEVSGNLVERFAKKWWLIERDPDGFGNLVLTNQITPDNAIETYKNLRKLPEYYRPIALKYLVNADCLLSLRQLEMEYEDEFIGTINSGFMDNGRDTIPLVKLTSRDVESFYRRLKWEESQLRREINSEVQIATIQKQGLLILDGLDAMEGLVEHSGKKNLTYIFPEKAYTPIELARVLENHKYDIFVIGVYATENEADIRLGNNTFIPPSNLNGKKPQYLLDAFRYSTMR